MKKTTRVRVVANNRKLDGSGIENYCKISQNIRRYIIRVSLLLLLLIKLLTETNQQAQHLRLHGDGGGRGAGGGLTREEKVYVRFLVSPGIESRSSWT